MTKYFFIAFLVGLLVSAGMAFRPDPWDAAGQVAQTHAGELAQLAPRSDLIDIRVAENAPLRQAALWDLSGDLLYPLSGAFSPLQNELEDAELIDVRAIIAATDDAVWMPFDRAGHELLYCQAAPAACLVYDRVALVQAAGLPADAVPRSAAVQIWAGLLALVSLAFGLAAIWQRRHANQQLQNFELLPDQFQARRGDKNIALTKRDIQILALLQERAGAVVTRDELYDAGWGRDFMPNSRALDQHIINLRRKLDPDKKRPELIETVRGIGYRFLA